ncbi:MAG: transketolase C-terminal domain-containing protein [Thermoprotei archaeon]
MQKLRQIRQTLSGNYAVAYAVKQVDVDVIAAYPITPQTTMVEKLSEYVATGELQAEYVPVESEHSALSVVTAAAAVGARVFTSTSSQGLLLMHEILFITAALRLPVVMAVANRAVSAPINIWNDHSDAMDQRDTGWIQIFAESSQEAYDTMIQAYRIAEDPRVRLPVMVNFDGYILTHTYEPVDTLPDEYVREFTPRVKPPFRLNPDEPVSIGTLAPPDYYYEVKYQEVNAIENSLPIIDEVSKEYGDLSGRYYSSVEPTFAKDADIVLISMGALSGTARYVVRELRQHNIKAGLIKLRLFRPFPIKPIIDLISDTKAVGIIDRAVSPGAIGGPVFMEIAAIMKLYGIDVPIVNFIAGLGGRDVTPNDIKYMFDELQYTATSRKSKRPVYYIGLRGWNP